MDFGQGALALVVALISVSTLAIETGARAVNATLSDPFAPNIAANVLSLDLEEVKLLIANNGTSRAYLHEGALCRVPVVKPGVDLITDDGTLVRYPKRHEVAYIYALSFHGTPEGSRFLDANAGAVIAAPRASVIREEGLPVREGATEVKGYCFVSWIGQDSREDGAFLEISALDSHRTGKALAEFPEAETVNGKVEASAKADN